MFRLAPHPNFDSVIENTEKIIQENLEDEEFQHIHKIVMFQDVETLQNYITKHPESVKHITKDGDTALHIVLSEYIPKWWKMAKLLLKNGADPNVQNIKGQTPIFYVLMWDEYEKIIKAIDLLKTYNVDLFIKTIDNHNLLFYAINHKEFLENCLSRLLKAGLNINDKDIIGEAPIHIAAKSNSNSEKKVKFLLENNADVNITNNDLNTPLHFACRHNTSIVVNILLEYNANVNAQNSNGSTPMHYARLNIHGLSIITILLELNNADPNIPDNNGITPIHHLYRFNRKIGKLMMPKIKNINVKDTRTGSTPFDKVVFKFGKRLFAPFRVRNLFYNFFSEVIEFALPKEVLPTRCDSYFFFDRGALWQFIHDFM